MQGGFSGYSPLYPPGAADPLSQAWYPGVVNPTPHFTYWVRLSPNTPLRLDVMHRRASGAAQTLNTLNLVCPSGIDTKGQLLLGGSGR